MPDRFVGALVFWNRAHAPPRMTVLTIYGVGEDDPVEDNDSSSRDFSPFIEISRTRGRGKVKTRKKDRGRKSVADETGTKTKGEGALFGAKESRSAKRDRQKGRGGPRRKDTSSLGAKKRNGHSPARWRKVGRSQPLTGAKETLRAIADSCPLGRGASRDRSPFLSLIPWSSILLPLSLSSFLCFSASLLFFSTLYVPLPPHVTDRSRKITESDPSNGNSSVEASTRLLLCNVEPLCCDDRNEVTKLDWFL